MALELKVISEADPSLGLKPSEKAREDVWTRAAGGMTLEQIGVLADEGIRRSSSPLLTCDAVIAFYAGLNGVPASERGRALRTLYAGN